MYNRSLVNIMIVSGIVELLMFLIYTYMYRITGTIGMGEYWIWLTILSGLTQLPFLGIMFYYQNYQKRYLLYSIFGFITLLTFIPVVTGIFPGSNFLPNFLRSQSLADINFIGSTALMVIAFYISVDNGTLKSVKRLMMWNSVFYLVFKTPLVIWLVFFTNSIFSGLTQVFDSVILVLVVLQFVLSAVLTYFKAQEVNEVDFM